MSTKYRTLILGERIESMDEQLSFGSWMLVGTQSLDMEITPAMVGWFRREVQPQVHHNEQGVRV